MADKPRFITPEGFRRLRLEYDGLFSVERPKLVETVSWAASLGDRSENADYIYGKRRLREIYRRLGHLARIMKPAKVVVSTYWMGTPARRLTVSACSLAPP